jgi:2'-5' RNA ligase
MHRLFVAIDPPFAAKHRLVGMMGGIIGARWQSQAQLHLTLRFIGEVDARRANAIAEVLATIRHPAFVAAPRGIGTFDRKGRIDTLWIGVEPAEPLRALHNKVDRALTRVGIAPDTRAYLPHITLARFSRGAGPLDGFMHASGGAELEAFTVDSFCLYESRLTEAGADYSIVGRFAFAS